MCRKSLVSNSFTALWVWVVLEFWIAHSQFGSERCRIAIGALCGGVRIERKSNNTEVRITVRVVCERVVDGILEGSLAAGERWPIMENQITTEMTIEMLRVISEGLRRKSERCVC